MLLHSKHDTIVINQREEEGEERIDPYTLFKKLRAIVPECSSLSDMDLEKVVAQPSMIHLKQKILAYLFQSNGVPGLVRIMENRKTQKVLIEL